MSENKNPPFFSIESVGDEFVVISPLSEIQESSEVINPSNPVKEPTMNTPLYHFDIEVIENYFTDKPDEYF